MSAIQASDFALPIVHLNGTSRDDLLCGYLEVKRALTETLNRMNEHYPHERDYYVSPDPAAYIKARQQHVDRQLRLKELIAEYDALAESVA